LFRDLCSLRTSLRSDPLAIDKPPFAVTETGWGEFPLNIRVQFAPETGEKSVNFVHQLRLHHWGPAAQPPADNSATPAPSTATPGVNSAAGAATVPATQESTPNPEATVPQPNPGANDGQKGDGDVVMASADDEQDADGEADSAIGTRSAENQSTPQASAPMQGIVTQTTMDGNATTTNPAPEFYVNPLPVHAWQYDELVFSDPTATFYDLLISHPETPLPETSLRQPNGEGAGARWGMDKGSAGVPLEFTQEMARGEGEKLERARRLVIDEMDKWR
jgi:YEATS domain-containing protein 4